MTAEIICVGTELLLGDILNTNARFLARELAELGIDLLHQQVVGDNAARLEKLVREAKSRSDLLIFSGGLGPTADDLTKETVARCFNDELVFEPSVMQSLNAYFLATGRSTPKNNEKQAMVPQKGGWFANPNGTAPAVWFREGAKYAVLLPGPPRELEPLWSGAVRPMLQRDQQRVLHSLVLRVAGVGESHAEELVGHLFQSENPTAAIYAKTGEVHIRITAAAPTNMEAKAMCRAYAQKFYALLGDAVYGEGEDGLENVLVKTLAKKNLTVATAESCTGGLVAQRITAVPGSSEVFGFGFVTYANAAKRQLLGVDPMTLAECGAVSPQVAAQMAAGAQKAAGASLAVALTGVAGPGGGTEEKPVGLVWLGAAKGERIFVKELRFGPRSRESIRWMAASAALDAARRLAAGLPIPGAEAWGKTEKGKP